MCEMIPTLIARQYGHRDVKLPRRISTGILAGRIAGDSEGPAGHLAENPIQLESRPSEK